MGEEAESVLSSTNITDANREKYDSVMSKFDEFFQVRKNFIFEQAKFNRRIQLERESVEQFIAVLYTLVETCDYRTLKCEMICDRIIVGITLHSPNACSMKQVKLLRKPRPWLISYCRAKFTTAG